MAGSLAHELAIGSGFGERTAKFKILRRSFVAVCYNYLNLGKRQMSKFIRFVLVSICVCATYAGLKYAFILFITWFMFSGVYFDGPGTLLAIPLTFLSSSVIFDYYCIALGSHLLFLSLLKGRDVKTRWILPLFFIITLAFCSFCVLIGHEDYQRINALFALLLISPFTLIAYAIVTTVILAKNKISDYLKEKNKSYNFKDYYYSHFGNDVIKEKYFKFLESHTKKEIQDLIDEFWETKKSKIYPWVKEELKKNKKEADFVIVSSASPLFLIENFLLSQGFDVIFGTKFVGDNQKKFVAQINGKNNKGDEKVKKLNRWAKQNNYEIEIVKFYSDSLADKPLYDIAKQKFWIKRGKILEGMPKRKTLIDKLFWN